MKMKNRVLAVLALALLMINMVPVRTAKAAETSDGVYYPELLTEVDLGTYEEQVRGLCDKYPYLFVVNQGGGYYSYCFLNDSKPCGFVNFGSSSCSLLCNAIVYISDSKVTNVSEQDYLGHTFMSGQPDVLIGTNFTLKMLQSDSAYVSYTESKPQNNLVHPNDYIPAPVYSSSAPYLKDVVFSNVNNFLLEGDTDFTQSVFRYTFELGNADTECVSRKTQISGYVYLPSKEFIDHAKSYYMGGRDTLDEYYSIYSCEHYPTWLKSLDLGDGSTYKKWYFTTEFDCTESAVLRLSHQEVYELVEQTNNVDLREYYGISDVAFIDHVLKGYMWIHRLDGVVYTTYSDVVNYGNLTSFICSTYLKNPVISIGYSDPFLYGPPVDFVGPMLPDSNVHQSLEQAYKDALEEANKQNENNLELDGDSEDLFDLFGSLSDGLSSMSGSVRKIATAVGNVFAFFPGEITSVLYAGLIAMVVIAIYKGIRG